LGLIQILRRIDIEKGMFRRITEVHFHRTYAFQPAHDAALAAKQVFFQARSLIRAYQQA
jgi:hypothetical protein